MPTVQKSLILFVCLLLQAQTTPTEIVVMTSGTFTAAHLELAPDFERTATAKVTTAATAMETVKRFTGQFLARSRNMPAILPTPQEHPGVGVLPLLIRNGRYSGSLFPA